MSDGSDWYYNQTTLLEEVRRTQPTRQRAVVIAGYEDIQLLRRGGQGAVYVALQCSTRRRVAIKVLYENGFASQMRRRRFELEIELIAALQHPNIVRIYDSGVTEDDRLYFVMEYIDGKSLDEHVAAAENLTVRDRLGLFADICKAVSFAHRHGVIHRDLKPSNIKVDPAGQPHVLDFGIAKLTTAGEVPTDSAVPTDVTLTGQLLGTLAYASPEQLQRDPSLVDTRTDVYSLGVILYEMLTGRSPYAVTGPFAEVIEAVTSSEPIPPSRVADRSSQSRSGGRLNEELDTLVLKALQKVPDRRYQSAEALRKDVCAYLDGEPIDAKRDSSWYLVQKTIARHKLPAALLAAAVVIFMGFTVALSVSYERTRVEAAKATQIKVFLEDTLASVQPAGVGREVTVREALDEAVQWVEIALADQPEVEASLRNTIGNSYRNLGAFDKAERQLQLALRLREELWGDEHLQVAQSLNTIGLLRRDQGQYDDAEHLFRESLAMRRRLLGEGHLDLTSSLMNLGGLQLERGRYAQAEQLYGEALAIRRRALGRQHADVAMCIYKLAMVAVARGDSTDAVRLHKEALAIRRRTLHAEHPDTARSLLALAGALMDAGDASQAEPLLRECFDVRSALFPNGHWQIAEVGSLWGACFTHLRKYQEAEPLLVVNFEFLLKMRGLSDPHTVAAIERCVQLYEAWGKAEQAKLYRDWLPSSTGN